MSPNKALHRTAVPLRFTAAGELGRSTEKNMNTYATLTNRLDKCWSHSPRVTSMIVGIVAWATSILLYFSWVMMIPENRYRWDDFLLLCTDPLRRDIQHPILYYRIAVPLIARILHLPPLFAFCIQYVASIATLSVVFWLIARKVRPITGLLATIGLALTCLTQWVNLYPGVPDSVTHLISAACMISIPAPFYLPFIFFGCLNDERMLFALPFILLWKYPEAMSDRSQFTTAIQHGCWMLLAVASWIVVRHMLSVGYIGPGIEKPKVYQEFSETIAILTPYASTWSRWLWNVFMSYRWIWVLPCLLLILGKHERATKAMLMFALLAVVLSTIIVADVSRSICFSFGAIMTAVVYLSREMPAQRLDRLLITLLIAQVITPTGFYVVKKILWLSPPFYKLARTFISP